MATSVPTTPAYPLSFSVDYPDRPLNRLTTGLRFLWIIPIGIVVGSVSGGYITVPSRTNSYAVIAIAGGLLFLGPLLMILFRQKYPRWWLDWNLHLVRFSTRVLSYLALTSDKYPST